MNLRPRLASATLVLTTAGASWYGMMIVHESGHVLAAWMSGGRVAKVVLDPLSFSRTDLSANPQPMFVAAAGPVWGSLLPLAVWLILHAARAPLAFLARAFAGFCLIANGLYLASAVILPIGDSQDLLRLGAPLWALVTPGLAAFVGGLTLWNGLGRYFGFYAAPVNSNAIIVATSVFGSLLLAMTLYSCLI